MNDDWMDNPIEMDDWINTLEEETKGQKSGSGGRSPSNGGCLSGCGTVVVGIIIVIVLIALIITVVT